jgi:hypothetical protein
LAVKSVSSLSHLFTPVLSSPPVPFTVPFTPRAVPLPGGTRTSLCPGVADVTACTTHRTLARRYTDFPLFLAGTSYLHYFFYAGVYYHRHADAAFATFKSRVAALKAIAVAQLAWLYVTSFNFAAFAAAVAKLSSGGGGGVAAEAAAPWSESGEARSLALVAAGAALSASATVALGGG